MKYLHQLLTVSKINVWRYDVKQATHRAYLADPACLSWLPTDDFGRRL